MLTATSISNLKTLVPPANNETCLLLGAVLPGDGGGGNFYYNSSSSLQENDGTIVKPSAISGNGRWIRVFSETINVKWFTSKVVNGDWSPAFQAAFNLGMSIFLPNGDYRIDTPLNNVSHLSIAGESVAANITTASDINIFNFTNEGFIQIKNLTFSAHLAQAAGAAININAPGAGKKLGLIENIRISRNGPSDSFKYGIKVTNPRELVLRDILIEGNGTASLIGVDFTSNVSSISPTLENVKVYDAKIGLQIKSNSNPSGLGIEGVKVTGCDFAGVEVGVAIDNTFGGPGFNFDNCHINSISGCISIKTLQQIFISDSLFYMTGGTSNYGVVLDNVSEASISTNKFFLIGNGFGYGVLCNAGATRNIKVTDNYLKLKPAGNETAIWFGPNSSRNQAIYNNIEGISSGFAVLDQGTNNYIAGNMHY